MRPNLQFLVDLFSFTGKVLNRKLYFFWCNEITQNLIFLFCYQRQLKQDILAELFVKSLLWTSLIAPSPLYFLKLCKIVNITISLVGRSYVMLRAILYHLRKLKNVKYTNGELLLLVEPKLKSKTLL